MAYFRREIEIILRLLWTIAGFVAALFAGIEGRGQSVLDQQMLGYGAYSKSEVNIFSTAHNQAALANLKSFTVGAFMKQRFSIKNLRSVYLHAGVPVPYGLISLHAAVEGYKAFKKQKFKAAYSRNILPWLDVGAELIYLKMYVPEYGSAHAATFSVSALTHVGEKWHIGMRIFNPTRIHYKKLGNDPIPDIYQLGAGYQLSDLLLLMTEARFSSEESSLMFAFKYHIDPVLSLSAGTSTGANAIFGGISLYLRGFEVLLSVSYHNQLGWTPGAGFIYLNQPDYE